MNVKKRLLHIFLLLLDEFFKNICFFCLSLFLVVFIYELYKNFYGFVFLVGFIYVFVCMFFNCFLFKLKGDV